MKILIGRLVNLYTNGSIQRFCATQKPGNLSWERRKLPKIVNEEVAEYKKAEVEIFRRYGEEVVGQDGNRTIKVRPTEMKVATEELKELQAQEIELPGDAVSFSALINPQLSELDNYDLEEAGFLKD